MKRLALALLFILFLVGNLLPSATAGDEGTLSAVGHYQISYSDEAAKIIDFNARLERSGRTVGDMTFQDSPTSSSAQTTEEVDSRDASRPFFLRANFDCMMVSGNTAIMSGSVAQSSLERYLGRRVLLVVQDNGHGVDPAKRDKLTWGLYRKPTDTSFSTDSERPDEQGAMTWLVTDAERVDDTGMLNQRSEEIGCHSFPLSAFSFLEAKQGRGTIQVRSGAAPQQVLP